MRIPPERLLHDLLLTSAQATPDKIVMVVEGKPYTYAQLLDGARRLAGALRDRGIVRGDRVAIYMENTFECAVSIYGTLMAGGVFLVVNPQTKDDKLAYILDDSDARILTDGTCTSVPGRSTIASPHRRVRLRQAPVGEHSKLEAFWDVLEASAPSTARPEHPSDLASLIYTSGSTGNPKGVMMTHQSMVFTAGSLLEYLRLSDEHRILNVLPLAFDYGLYQLLMSVRRRHAGARALLHLSGAGHGAHARAGGHRLSRRADDLRDARRHAREVAHLIPHGHAHHQHRGGASQGFSRPCEEIFPNALIFKMYGLTECKRVAYLEPELMHDRPTSVGKAIPGTETFVLSPEGEPVAPGETGVLHVRGPHVMLGYWNQPEQSAEMLKPGPLPGERMLCTRTCSAGRGGLPLLRRAQRRHHQDPGREGEAGRGRERAPRHPRHSRGRRHRRPGRGPRAGDSRLRRARGRCRARRARDQEDTASRGSRTSWSPGGRLPGPATQDRSQARSARTIFQRFLLTPTERTRYPCPSTCSVSSPVLLEERLKALSDKPEDTAQEHPASSLVESSR